MLEQKIKLKKAMKEFKPKTIVYRLYNEYDKAYKRMKHPNEKDKKEYVDLYFQYTDYMNKMSGSQK